MDPSPTMSDDGAGRVKKTRRRLRLSCVECTKRRQKCDRQHPCGLCVTRGVAHLCRWESVPMARPAPARPPASALREVSVTDQTDIIQDLKQRIVALEKDLESARRSSPSITLVSGGRTPTPKSPSVLEAIGAKPLGDSSRPSPKEPQSPATPFVSSNPQDLGSLLFPLDDNIYGSTSTLAQLSLGHHGEFIGRGSLLCALHSIASRHLPRFLYANSTDSMSNFADPPQKFSDMQFCASVEQLVPSLPSMVAVESLIGSYFSDVNWRYGIPEKWFRRAQTQMWMNLQLRQTEGAHINASWLMLLFAMLASAPQSAYIAAGQLSSVRSSDDYFMCAMMARRIVEDEYLNAPAATLMVSAADGTVLACLATLLLCNYLAERGRISEAWKLVSYGIRNAQAVGMHRDPEWKLWQTMSGDEKILRRRAWWGLYILDKAYSYVLGRPQIIRRETYDVELPSPFNEDETRNFFNTSQSIIVGFMELLAEAMEKCFSIEYPNCSYFLEMDQKFEHWEESLPRVFRMDYDLRLLQECSPVDLKMVARQRYVLHSWYLLARLKIYIASTTGQARIPPPSHVNRHCMESCIQTAMQVIRFQTSAYNASLRHDFDPTAPIFPGSTWFFEGCFSLFEGSVALITTLARYPWPEKVSEANALIETALTVFQNVTRKERGKLKETSQRAVDVLETLREDYWPERRTLLPHPRVKDESMLLTGQDSYPVNHKITTSSPTALSPSTQFSVSCVRDHNFIGHSVRDQREGGLDGHGYLQA